jgi:hypothetical protein
MKKLAVLIFAISLTLLVGAKTLAAPTVDINLSSNPGEITQEPDFVGFSGSIDFYHPDSNVNAYKNDLPLNLNYGPHHGPGPGHGPRGSGPRMGYGPPPGLWVYTFIGIVVVALLSHDDLVFD